MKTLPQVAVGRTEGKESATVSFGLARRFFVIEDFVDPAIHLHSLIWWDKAAQRFKTAGCDDLSDQGCQLESGLGRWDDNQVVWKLTVPKDGKDVPAKIVRAEKDSRSFMATMYIADATGTLKRVWTFLHTRVK